jgi:hypothetical protein
VNNLCDNALLAGYAAGETTIGRDLIEEVAETFDMLPSPANGMQAGDVKEAPPPIFSPASRAELWAAGTASTEGEPELDLPVPVDR